MTQLNKGKHRHENTYIFIYIQDKKCNSLKKLANVFLRIEELIPKNRNFSWIMTKKGSGALQLY
jgi:hypothetical protein